MTYKPTEKALTLKLDMVNELTTVFLVDFLTVFSEANPSSFEVEGDSIFLAFLFGNLAIHLFFLAKSTITGARKSCKRCRRRCSGKKAKAKRRSGKKAKLYNQDTR